MVPYAASLTLPLATPAAGKDFYMDGFKPGEADTVVSIMNLVLELTD